MAGYGGNTPCIEVVATCGGGGDTNHDNDNDGHRIILDLGSGAVDLGQKVLGEMFASKKKKQSEEESEEKSPKVEVAVTKPKPKKFGGSILITHTHWDHIQGDLLQLQLLDFIDEFVACVPH